MKTNVGNMGLGRIVGGRNVPNFRHPYNAGLVDWDGLIYCGGALIAPNIIMTAAHAIWRTSTASTLGSTP